jgi:pimeloyl-ACP methyl ester carboxylesterase
LPLSDFELARLLEGQQAPAIVYSVDGVAHILLRGSASPFDWAQNFLPLLYPHPMLGEVHAGFLTAASQILAQIAPQLASERRFVIAGHSRGGAIACLLAGLLRARGQVAEAIVTFGAPRAGTADLKDFLRGIAVRQYRNGEDAVPDWPDPPFCHVADALLTVGNPVNPKADHGIAAYVTALRISDARSRAA